MAAGPFHNIQPPLVAGLRKGLAKQFAFAGLSSIRRMEHELGMADVTQELCRDHRVVWCRHKPTKSARGLRALEEVASATGTTPRQVGRNSRGRAIFQCAF